MERPTIPYSSLILDVEPHHDPTFEEKIQFRAIDFMLDTLRVDPVWEEHFASKGLTLGDIETLKVPGGRDVLVGVHTPEDLIVAVGVNTQDDHLSGEEISYEDKMREWGVRMRDFVKDVDENDHSLDAQAKRLIKDVISMEALHLGLDPESQRV